MDGILAYLFALKQNYLFILHQTVYLDRVGRHVAHEVSAVGVIQHGHQSEGIPQQAVQLVDVLIRCRRLTQGEL